MSRRWLVRRPPAEHDAGACDREAEQAEPPGVQTGERQLAGGGLLGRARRGGRRGGRGLLRGSALGRLALDVALARGGLVLTLACGGDVLALDRLCDGRRRRRRHGGRDGGGRRHRARRAARGHAARGRRGAGRGAGRAGRADRERGAALGHAARPSGRSGCRSCRAGTAAGAALGMPPGVVRDPSGSGRARRAHGRHGAALGHATRRRRGTRRGAGRAGGQTGGVGVSAQPGGMPPGVVSGTRRRAGRAGRARRRRGACRRRGAGRAGGAGDALRAGCLGGTADRRRRHAPGGAGRRVLDARDLRLLTTRPMRRDELGRVRGVGARRSARSTSRGGDSAWSPARGRGRSRARRRRRCRGGSRRWRGAGAGAGVVSGCGVAGAGGVAGVAGAGGAGVVDVSAGGCSPDPVFEEVCSGDDGVVVGALLPGLRRLGSLGGVPRGMCQRVRHSGGQKPGERECHRHAQQERHPPHRHRADMGPQLGPPSGRDSGDPSPAPRPRGECRKRQCTNQCTRHACGTLRNLPVGCGVGT